MHDTLGLLKSPSLSNVFVVSQYISVRGILFQRHRVQNAMGSGNEKREWGTKLQSKKLPEVNPCFCFACFLSRGWYKLFYSQPQHNFQCLIFHCVFIHTNLLCYCANKRITVPLWTMFPHDYSFISQLLFVNCCFHDGLTSRSFHLVLWLKVKTSLLLLATKFNSESKKS